MRAKADATEVEGLRAELEALSDRVSDDKAEEPSVAQTLAHLARELAFVHKAVNFLRESVGKRELERVVLTNPARVSAGQNGLP